MISPVAETSGASIDEVKYHIFLKLRSGNFGQKRIFQFSLYSLEIFQTNTIINS